jgi:hypothetical protein
MTPAPVAVLSPKRIGTIDSVPKLFATAFDLAIRLLSAAELWALHVAHEQERPLPAWLPPDQLKNLSGTLAALATRPQASRYRLRQHDRDGIVASLGGYQAFGDGKAMFALTWAIDDAFASFVFDHGHTPMASEIIPVCPAFFQDVTNAPPSLGQMRPVAICRRWLRNMHVCGRLDGLTGFGAFPSLARRPLPADVREAFARAKDDERELRIALVSWRDHHDRGDKGPQFESRERGLFAVTGYRSPARPKLLADVLERARERKAHIVVLPEISLGQTELEELRSLLRGGRARFPCLVVAGLTHQRGADGYVNEAVLLSSAGDVVLRSKKTEPFYGTKPGLEDIVGTALDEYPYVDTPVGRLVVNVCRDVRSDVPMLLNRAIGASLILVPAYSDRLDFVVEEARLLGQRQAAIVTAVNPRCGHLRDVYAVYGPVRGCSGLVVEKRQITDEGDLAIEVIRFFFADHDKGQIRADLAVAV